MLAGVLRRAHRVINFNAGQSQLPLEVLNQAAAEMSNWNGTGLGVMEMMHRHTYFHSILNTAVSDFRELMRIPDNYYVLFLQGGARLFFDSIPLNIGKTGTPGDYLVTGYWSNLAYQYGAKYISPQLVASSESVSYGKITPFDQWKLTPNASFFHFCANETINGVELNLTPEMFSRLGNVPIVADMSSNILSQEVDVAKFGVIYAGAQKNAGPAGVTIAIIRKDLVGRAQSITPCVMDWKLTADENSMYNTPPCYGIYMIGLYLKYMKAHGGIPAFHAQSLAKSGLIYEAIDGSKGFYTTKVHPSCRSRMNIPMSVRQGDSALEKRFLKEAEALGMVHLAGHYTAGGIRASLYNGITLQETQKLADFMHNFRKEHNR